MQQMSRHVLGAFAYTMWTIFAGYGSLLLVGTWVMQPLLEGGYLPAVWKNSPAWIMTMIALQYIISLGAVLLLPLAMRLPLRQLKQRLGVIRWPQAKDLLLAVLAWAAYFVVAMIVVTIVIHLIPQLNMTQEQEIGFTSGGGLLSTALAFVSLVLLAPIAEELLFRGFLFGNLRRHISFVLATIITSLLFALAHGQWNVGIDVFIVSLALCYLRERTGNIWAGVMLHMIKNMIAFSVLFLAPEWIKQLLGG